MMVDSCHYDHVHVMTWLQPRSATGTRDDMTRHDMIAPFAMSEKQQSSRANAAKARVNTWVRFPR